MKRIKVGRSKDCDIIIPDTCDLVSRHHLVISFDILGRMTLSDTSSNGTTINDHPIVKGISIPVSRKDKIIMGDDVLLDWEQIQDPYRTTRKALISIFAIVCALSIGVFCYFKFMAKEEKIPDSIEHYRQEDNSGEWTADSTLKVAPKETYVDITDKDPSTKPQSTHPSSKSTSKAANKANSSNTSQKQTVSHSKKSNAMNKNSHVLKENKKMGMSEKDPEEYSQPTRKASSSTTSEKEGD